MTESPTKSTASRSDLQQQFLKQQVESLEKATAGESPRAKIILFATQIDEMLKELLLKFLKQGRKTDDELFRDGAPLSSFAARIALAFRVGLISKDDADAFDTLRKIRNECAHKIFEFDFTKSPRSDQLKRFVTLTRQDPSRATAIDDLARPQTDEERLISCCLVHIFYLHETTARVTQCPDGFSTDLFFMTNSRDKI
jgi:hypothetical protein